MPERTASGNASRQRSALPSVQDINRAAAYPSDARNLVRICDYVAAGRLVWWRRSNFRTPFGDVEPKWHILAARTRSDDPETRWTFTWHGLCGFQNEYTELLGGFRHFRVSTPKKDERCQKCAAALKAITAAANTTSAAL